MAYKIVFPEPKNIIKKPEPYCTSCKGNQVLLDAFASWDVENQCWILFQTFDDSFCNNCKQECEYEFK